MQRLGSAMGAKLGDGDPTVHSYALPASTVIAVFWVNVFVILGSGEPIASMCVRGAQQSLVAGMAPATQCRASALVAATMLELHAAAVTRSGSRKGVRLLAPWTTAMWYAVAVGPASVVSVDRAHRYPVRETTSLSSVVLLVNFKTTRAALVVPTECGGPTANITAPRRAMAAAPALDAASACRQGNACATVGAAERTAECRADRLEMVHSAPVEVSALPLPAVAWTAFGAPIVKVYAQVESEGPPATVAAHATQEQGAAPARTGTLGLPVNESALAVQRTHALAVVHVLMGGTVCATRMETSVAICVSSAPTAGLVRTAPYDALCSEVCRALQGARVCVAM